LTIRLDLFICVYIILLCLFPEIILLKESKKKSIQHNYKSYLNLVYNLIFCLYLISFTMLDIDITLKKISITIPKIDKVTILFEKNFSIYNSIINIALFAPIGLFLLVNFKSNSINPTLIGLILGLIIESLQILLPTNRIFDIFDIFLNGAVSFVSFFIFYLINKSTLNWVLL